MIFCVLAVARILLGQWQHNLCGCMGEAYSNVPQEEHEPIGSKPRPSPSDQDHFSVHQSESFLDADLVVKLKMAGQCTNTRNVIGQNKSDPTKWSSSLV